MDGSTIRESRRGIVGLQALLCRLADVRLEDELGISRTADAAAAVAA